MMKILDLQKTPKDQVISHTIEVLNAGGLVLFPTETTYGAGVDATNQAAVNKLLAYKSRREGKPLSIMVANEHMAAKYVAINEQARKIYTQFLPGPVTVVSKSLGTVASGVASEFGTLGVRIPDYQLMLDIVQQYQKPITATSANASGKKTPYSISDIMSGLSNKQKSLIDLILDAGELPHNQPSTVIDTTLSTPVTLRNGSKTELNHTTESIALISHSQRETQEIAQRLALKYWKHIQNQGIIFALDGSLGVGKTIFAKGIAEFLTINETISSPTYTYIEEYNYTRHQTSGMFYHLDMWKVENEEMFKRLEINKLVKPNAILVIEWYDQIQEYANSIFSDKPIISIFIEQENEDRKLTISEKNI